MISSAERIKHVPTGLWVFLAVFSMAAAFGIGGLAGSLANRSSLKPAPVEITACSVESYEFPGPVSQERTGPDDEHFPGTAQEDCERVAPGEVPVGGSIRVAGQVCGLGEPPVGLVNVSLVHVAGRIPPISLVNTQIEWPPYCRVAYDVVWDLSLPEAAAAMQASLSDDPRWQIIGTFTPLDPEIKSYQWTSVRTFTAVPERLG